MSGIKSLLSSPPPPTPTISLDIRACSHPAEFNAEVVLLYSRVYNSKDKELLEQFASRYIAPDYNTTYNGKQGVTSRKGMIAAVSAGMDKGWRMDNPSIYEAAVDHVIWAYNLGSVSCKFNHVFKTVGVIASGVFTSQ